MLVAGTVVAMVLTQKARERGPVAFNVKLKTKPGRYRPCFRLTESDTVDVAIVDANGRVVVMLADDQPLEGDDASHCFDWDGRDSSGNSRRRAGIASSSPSGMRIVKGFFYS